MTVRDRIIVHLYPYIKHAEDFECPAEMCQAGISNAIGKSRAHVTLELGRMMEAGLLHERMAHVKGARSKRKTYSLTATGIAKGAEISAHLDAVSIALSDDGRVLDVTGSAAAEALRAAEGISRAMAVDRVLCCGGSLAIARNGDAMPGPPGAAGKRPAALPRPELALVAEAVSGGKVHIVAVLGIPGIGKTSLLAAVTESAGAGAHVVQRRLYPFDSPGSVLNGIAGQLRGFGFPALHSYLERNGPADLPEAGANLRRCLKGARFVLILDDCDLAPEPVRPVLSMLSEFARGTGSVLVAASARKPDFYSAGDVGDGSAVEVRLGPLDRETALRLFMAEGGSASDVGALAAAKGHPLALKLLASGLAPGGLASFVEDEVLGRDDDMARLCRFASVLRRPFDPDDLEAIGFRGAPSARRAMLLEPQPGGGWLLHPAISAMLLGSMGARALKGAHSTAAGFYIDAGAHPAEALHHLAEAGEAARAREFALEQCDSLAGTDNPHELADILERLLRGKGAPPGLAEMAAWAMNSAGRWDRAMELADAAMRAGTDPAVAVRAMDLKARILAKRGRPDEALAVLEEAFGTGGGPAAMAGARLTAASALRMLSRNAEALEQCLAAEGLAEEAGDQAALSRAAMERAMVLEALGDLEPALAALEAAADGFARIGSLQDTIKCRVDRGFLLAVAGRADEARGALEEAIGLADSSGLYRLKGYAEADLSHILAGAGMNVRAAALAEDAARIFAELDEPLMLAVSLYNLGMARAGLGMGAEATECMDRALAIVERLGMLQAKADWLEGYAGLLRSMGDARKAAALLRKLKKPKR